MGGVCRAAKPNPRRCTGLCLCRSVCHSERSEEPASRAKRVRSLPPITSSSRPEHHGFIMMRSGETPVLAIYGCPIHMRFCGWVGKRRCGQARSASPKPAAKGQVGQMTHLAGSYIRRYAKTHAQIIDLQPETHLKHSICSPKFTKNGPNNPFKRKTAESLRPPSPTPPSAIPDKSAAPKPPQQPSHSPGNPPFYSPETSSSPAS